MNEQDALQHYLSHFAQEDEILRWIQSEAQRLELPTISLQPAEGKLLYLMLKACGAKKVLEIGALGGYSGTWLARALPADGHLWTLEKSPRHAAAARAAFEKAGVSELVTLIEGEARQSLGALAANAPFDFIFLDADTENYVHYLGWAGDHLRSGGILTAHNALVGGAIAAPTDARARGMSDFQEQILGDPRFETTIIAWGDGLLLAVRR